MTTITVKISSKTRRGNYLSDLLQEMAKTGKDIIIERIQNAETIEAMEDTENGKVTRVNSVDELFDSI